MGVVVSRKVGKAVVRNRVRRRLRVFRALYAVTSVAMLPHALRNGLRRRRQSRVGFSGETLQEEP